MKCIARVYIGSLDNSECIFYMSELNISFAFKIQTEEKLRWFLRNGQADEHLAVALIRKMIAYPLTAQHFSNLSHT